MKKNDYSLPPQRVEELLKILELRFNKNINRHEGLHWSSISEQLLNRPDKLWSLNEMEETGGEPDVVQFEKSSSEYFFCDCSPESPKGRRSICYDQEALNSRKEHKPANSAVGMAAEMGIAILSEEEYRNLQTFGKFDAKSSSWVLTPPDVRKLGGALFCDWRYGKVFTYHNGAESYYAARGFRGILKI